MFGTKPFRASIETRRFSNQFFNFVGMTFNNRIPYLDLLNNGRRPKYLASFRLESWASLMPSGTK